MRTALLFWFAFIFAVSIVASVTGRSANQTLDARRAELKRLLSEEWEYTLQHSPELATDVGDDRYNDRLSDFSDKAIAADL